MKRICVITTVLNEEKTIKDLLDSLFIQTLKPTSIIIVDGGSKDTTVGIIKSFMPKHKILKVVVKKGNRSVGRNEAIKLADCEIIACCDAGCILDKNWLKNITKPFDDKNVDVVSGFYLPVAKTVFEKCMAAYTCVMPDRLNDSFLPSSRSIAFLKKVAEKEGGYPEKLDTCEDLVFAKRLRQKDYKFKLAKNAIVLWPQQTTFMKSFKQFFNYAKGEGKARYFRKNTLFLFLRYLLAIFILFYAAYNKNLLLLFFLLYLGFLYAVWAIDKNYRYVKNPKAILILPSLQIISDIAVISGILIGFVNSIRL